jgi:hypothetical protein
MEWDGGTEDKETEAKKKEDAPRKHPVHVLPRARGGTFGSRVFRPALTCIHCIYATRIESASCARIGRIEERKGRIGRIRTRI